ncbi:MAG: phosphate ABC transporter substrate-binding protein [Candidatus Latescibacterota bacterium]
MRAIFGTIAGFAASAILMAGSVGADSIISNGSDTVLPLAQKEAEAFMSKHPEHRITVVGGGSGVGIAALIDGTTDIANASREIKIKEKRLARKRGITPMEHTVARDALSVIVHPKNPISKLTFDQLERIFTGDVKTWKDVGGPPKPIVIYSRDSSSGTYVFFKEHVLNKREFSPTALLQPSNGAIVQAISQTEGAIGYVGLPYLTKHVKALAVSRKEEAYVAPTMETAKTGTYPVTRALYMYTNGEPKGLVKIFLDFILSKQGQDIVEELGCIPVK